MTERDNVRPDGKWAFNAEVTTCFANMLERSIPDYRSMRSLVYQVGQQFIKPNTMVIDIGCSTGLAVEPLIVAHGRGNKFLLIDNAPAMVEACRKYYAGCEDFVRVEQGDLWDFLPLPGEPASLVLSILKADWNVDMLKTAGFAKVDMFWRCLNFCGWIAVK